MAESKHAPRVVDNDRETITITLDGKEIRSWFYSTDAERRTKMLAAREFCEGWHQAMRRSADPDMLKALKAADELAEVGVMFASTELIASVKSLRRAALAKIGGAA